MRVIINGQEKTFDFPLTVIAAAAAAHYDMPSFCTLSDCMPYFCTLPDCTSSAVFGEFKTPEPSGHCGVCICKTRERGGEWTLTESCHKQISEGIEILTYDAEIHAARCEAVGRLLEKHDGKCFTCYKSSQCKLQDYALLYPSEHRVAAKLPEAKKDTSNKFYAYDPHKCIKCYRCVAVCENIQCNQALALDNDNISVDGIDRGNSSCVSCGNCLQVCPTGALYPKFAHYNEREDKKVTTVCPYCGVGCHLNLFVKNGCVVGVTGADKTPNHGLTCVKGRFAYNFINHPNRLSTPLIRRDGVLVPCSWDEAYGEIAAAFQKAKECGNDTIAGLASARCTNEDNYIFQKFIRIAGGTNNVDHCARLCHSSTVAGLAYSFGSGAMTNSISEAVKSDIILVTGSNTTETHPIIGAAIRRAVQNGTRLIVAEPRQIDLCKEAEIFLQIKPGTNVAFLNGMMKSVLEAGLENKEFMEAHTEGGEEFLYGMQSVSVGECADICGISENDLREAAKLYAEAGSGAIYYSMGVTQHSTGTDGVKSVANLAMLCGQIGREGCGVNPLRGQNNVQGACDMGALPGDFPGYQKVANDATREKFGTAWGAELSKSAGMTSLEIIDRMPEGEVKFLYIMGENPLVSDVDLNHVREAFKSGKSFIVVQDIFLTETAEYADVVLPAVTFAEKDGTFTNTERRVQKLNPAIAERSGCKQDWRIICELAQKLGVTGFDYQNTSEIMDEIARLTPIYGGIVHERLTENGLQWPCPNKEHAGTSFLHKDGNFSQGKGRLAFRPYISAQDVTDNEYPLLLTTGRILYQYHTRTMTAKTAAIEEIAGLAFVEIHPQTAAVYGIKDGEAVEVTSPRGSVTAPAKITGRVGENTVFMPFHYAESPANNLTGRHLDPVCKIPEFKVSKVRIKKASPVKN